jgi:alpha-D-ribose 1-methylphosphonate 5-triphosphate synthase subunit PhnL
MTESLRLIPMLLALAVSPLAYAQLHTNDDETKRRRILQQLNKGEDRHKLARAIFHGKRANSASAIMKDRKINSGRSDWS